jgi:hypothetical protein
MKFRPLALAALAAVVVGCSSTATSSIAVSTVQPKSGCSGYLGAGVAVAMCSNKIARGSAPTAPAPTGQGADSPFTITLQHGAPRSGSAPGIAQAMGNALRDGESFEIGPTPDGAELLAHLDISPRRALATAVFHIPRSATSRDVEAQVAVDGRKIDAHLRLDSGERLAASYIYVPAGY